MLGHRDDVARVHPLALYAYVVHLHAVAALEILDELPDNVVRLDIYRLQSVAGLGDKKQTMEYWDSLNLQKEKIDSGTKQTLLRIHDGYCCQRCDRLFLRSFL